MIATLFHPTLPPMGDFQTYLDAVVHAEQAIKAHERDTTLFLQETAAVVLAPFEKAQGSGGFRMDETNRRSSRKDGFYSGELACTLPERNGVPSIESRVVLAARLREGGTFIVRINEQEGEAASPADFASQVFDTLVKRVRDDVVTALGSGKLPA